MPEGGGSGGGRGGRSKTGRPNRTPMLGADVPVGPSWSGASNVRYRRKQGRWCGVSLHRKGRVVRFLLTEVICV